MIAYVMLLHDPDSIYGDRKFLFKSFASEFKLKWEYLSLIKTK